MSSARPVAMRAEFKQIGGVTTRALVAGSPGSPPLLLIHGFGLSADSWIRNVKELAEAGFFVVAPDMVGHGFTDPLPLRGQPPHQTYLDHLEAVTAAYGFSEFCPVGSSFGALMGALLYFRHPKRVRKLVIVGSGSCFNNDDEVAATARQAYENQTPAMTAPTLEICRERMGRTVYDPASVPEALLHLQLTSYSRPGAFGAWKEAITGIMNTEDPLSVRIYGRLELVDAETLVVWGRQDPRGIYERAQEAVLRMPNAKLATFEKCGHFPALEHPELFNRELEGFLNGTTATEPKGR